MAGKLPGFITGANAKIILNNGKEKFILAYASDVSYNVDTVTVPVEVMGRYEVLTNEPVAYGVNGSFSVVRYTNLLKDSNVDGASAKGNPTAAMGFNQQFDPQQMLSSSTFDLDIHQKQRSPDGTVETVSVFKLTDCRAVNRSAVLNKRGVLVDTYRFVGIVATDGDVDIANTAAASGDKDITG